MHPFQEIGSSRSILNSEGVKTFTEVCVAVSAVLAPSPPSAEAAGSGRHLCGAGALGSSVQLRRLWCGVGTSSSASF